MASSAKKEKAKTATLDMGSRNPVEVPVVDGDSPVEESAADGAVSDDKVEKTVVPEVKKSPSRRPDSDLEAERALDARPRYIFTRELSNEIRERRMLYDLPMDELTELSDRLGGRRQFTADEIIGRVVWNDGEPVTCVSSGEKFQPHASVLLDYRGVREGFAKLAPQLSALSGGELTAEDVDLLSVKRGGKLQGFQGLPVHLGVYCVYYDPERRRWAALGPFSGTQFFKDPNTHRFHPNKKGCLGRMRYELGVMALKRERPNLLKKIEADLAQELGEDVVKEMGKAFDERVSGKFVERVKVLHDEHVQLTHTYSKEQVKAFVKGMNAQIIEREEEWKAGREKKATASAPRSPAERKFREEEERIRSSRSLAEMEFEID